MLYYHKGMHRLGAAFVRVANIEHKEDGVYINVHKDFDDGGLVAIDENTGEELMVLEDDDFAIMLLNAKYISYDDYIEGIDGVNDED